MKNPLFTRHVTQLVEFYLEIDTEVDKIERAQGTAERWQLEELIGRLAELIPLVDTMPLPGSARRAGNNVGDFFYSLKELSEFSLEQTEDDDEELPTVRDARKYDANPFEASVKLSTAGLGLVYVYREKARLTLQNPAAKYGLSVERAFAMHAQESQDEDQAIQENPPETR